MESIPINKHKEDLENCVEAFKLLAKWRDELKTPKETLSNQNVFLLDQSLKG